MNLATGEWRRRGLEVSQTDRESIDAVCRRVVAQPLVEEGRRCKPECVSFFILSSEKD